MTKRKITCLLSLIITTALLGGCVKNAEKMSAKEAFVTAKNAKEDRTTENASADFDTEAFAEAFEKGVADNGSYFVRVGNKVYFRKISPDSMKEGAEFGEFLNTEFNSVKCPLICFDLESGEWEEIGKIQGTGELYACPEGFYIGEVDQESPDDSCTWLYNPATGEQSYYCQGLPVGVSKSGKLLVVDQHQGQRGCFTTPLIKDGEEVVSLGDENNCYDYCGFAGEDLILIQREGWGGESDEEWIVTSVSEKGEVTSLGSLGTFNYDYPELKQFYNLNGTVYMVFGFYEGSGHFLDSWTTYKVVPGKKGSLEEVTDGKDDYYALEGYEEVVPRLCVDTDDYLFYSYGTPDRNRTKYYQALFAYCSDMSYPHSTHVYL